MASHIPGRLLIWVFALLALSVTAQVHIDSNNQAALEGRNVNTRARSIIQTIKDQHTVRAPSPIKIQGRDEPEGAECSPEGQWNCMPDTWQRCAAGKWSQVMDLAEGTICTPEGLTEEITIEHDGSVNGGDGEDSGNDGGDTFSGGARTGVAAGFAIAAGVFAML